MKIRLYFLTHIIFYLLFQLLLVTGLAAQEMSFTVSMPDPATQLFQVRLECEDLNGNFTDFKIPVWMPGYYQVLEYPEKIQNFRAETAAGKPVKWEKANRVTWRLYHEEGASLILSYNVLANRRFVATNYMDEDRAYIAPGGVFMHQAGRIDQPVRIKLEPYRAWTKTATGLQAVAGVPFTFRAPDYDVLYDSPILVGKLTSLPTFIVGGVPHRFIGYQLGEFDHAAFISDLQRVVQAAVDIIGDIPYEEYTFIGIGPGAGGIEHLNSTAVSFSGNDRMNEFAGRKRTLSFLGHEYFHHYNAKRIRPIELGPFDYDHGSRTNMLWVAEGITSYYDEMLLRRAGLVDGDEIIGSFEGLIRSVETSPGRLFQSVTQASFDTWSDGPFGRKGDEVNKTVSYYEKGPILGLLLDLKIRHETGNRKSLDDVMRRLYYDIYKKEGRGYTEAEFRSICEETAGVPLPEFFSYVYTVQPIDYAKYLGYAGLQIDLEPKALPGVTIGLQAVEKDGKVIVQQVEWNSPAWFEGIRRGQEIVKINGQSATVELLKSVSEAAEPNEIIKLEMLVERTARMILVLFVPKTAISFKIDRMTDLSPGQKMVLEGWLGK
ncbi:MAG: M61 family peptidase [Saprospiraceae bacterium]|nr:M61 family metallopeptidase [Lewinella sp.]